MRREGISVREAIGVEMNDTIDTKDIAELLGYSREYVTDRVTKREDFPVPVLRLSRKAVRWSAADVRAWLEGQSLRASKQSGSRSRGSKPG
jgi:predicted DNA-binding transcriptional regulator AlpA